MGSQWTGVCAVVMAGMCVCRVNAQVGPDTPGWFPFVMKGTDVAENAPVDVSFLNRRPADERISVRQGIFETDSGERIRFFGTNVTFSGAFPDKELTPAIAARLAQLGFNVVRFHHLDARDIWLPNQEGIDPEKLDRLHWFVYQLKQHGIYSNINLHVSRTYPGLRELDLPRTFRYGKVLDKFHEPYIRLQETYAEDLLAPVNPYSRLPLAVDPAVAFVELNNENTLLRLGPGELQGLTAPVLRQSLRQRWREWLTRHYDSLSALKNAWNENVVPLGEEILRNGGFDQSLDPWVLEGAAPGVCEMSHSEEGDGSAHIRITRPGNVAWAYQLHQLDVPLREGMSYTVTLRAKADPPREVGVALRFAEPPWTILSGRHTVELTPDWHAFTIPCKVSGIRDDIRLRFSLNFGDEVGDIWIADGSLRPGRKLFSAEGMGTLQDMRLPDVETPPEGWRDFRRFLVYTEREYVTRMRTFLRERIGVRSLIVDTQGTYGGYWGLWREASLSDYIDMHAYWQHPRFPGRPWDRGNWFIPNTSMVANENGGVYSRLTAYRVKGMPFSVSEYNHPAPNDHAAELFPMLASFASHQDWDALYQFSYCNRADGYTAEEIGSYFELCHHAGQLVFAPLMALMFRQELLPPAPEEWTVTVPLEALDEHLASGFPGDALVSPEALPMARRFSRRYGVRFGPTEDGRPDIPSAAETDGGPVLMAGAGIHWQTGDPAVFRAVGPAARVVVGEIGGTAMALGDIELTVRLPSRQWACVALVSADGQPVVDSKRMLLALAGRVENTGMGWNEERTTVGRQWGEPPVVAQAIPFVLTGPGKQPAVYALDSTGRRQDRREVATGEGGQWRLTVENDIRTMWYSLERD